MLNITEDQKKNIVELLQKEIDDLYFLVASCDPTLPDILTAPEEARKTGEKSFNRTIKSLKTKICEEWNYCGQRYSAHLNESVTLVAAMSDLIVALVGSGIPPTMTAVLLFKKILNEFCECDKDE